MIKLKKLLEMLNTSQEEKNKHRLDGKPYPSDDEIRAEWNKTKNVNAVEEKFNLDGSKYTRRYMETILGINTSGISPKDRTYIKALNPTSKKSEDKKYIEDLLRHKSSLPDDVIRFIEKCSEQRTLTKKQREILKYIHKQLAIPDNPS